MRISELIGQLQALSNEVQCPACHAELARQIGLQIKTRETEGGGHSHLFSRDLIAAINDLNRDANDYHVVAVIIAENWSNAEIDIIGTHIDLIFHFNMSPNRFMGFDEDTQIKLNRYVASILGGGNVE